ncbi:hypothetical protein C8Q80DRAFT_1271344 [Daedaleopsis nitida]|nr:hypothetical protein C8Q80DRAFT_1271344 [Daedaleopsis nitida]
MTSATGLLYFVTLFVLNILHLILSTTATFEEGNAVSLLTSFTSPLTAILAYRFIFDLQVADEHNIKIGSDNPELQMSMNSQSSLPSFVDRVIGALGSTIIPGTTPADGEPYNEELSDDDFQP